MEHSVDLRSLRGYSINCGKFKIFNGQAIILIDIDETILLETIKNSKSIEANSELDGYIAVCDHCKGSGKTDWVSNITGVTSKTILKFERKKNSKIRKFYFGNIFYMFEPKLNKDEKECRFCHGTGLYMITQATFLGIHDQQKDS